MLKQPQISDEWVSKLFQKDRFLLKLKQFVASSPQSTLPSLTKDERSVNMISEEISDLLFDSISKHNEKKFSIFSSEIQRISSEVSSLKSTLFQWNEKLDLQATNYNKSKLEFSSILQTDLGTDVKSQIEQLQEKFAQWFGALQNDKNTVILNQNLSNQSKLSKYISKKCTQFINLSEKKQIKRIQTGEVMLEKRMQQITKTLNNVLEMLNEANSKKMQSSNAQQIQPNRPQVPQASLQRQSSLQNLKIKSFFNFGHR